MKPSAFRLPAGSRRTDLESSGGSRKTLNQLLTEMDGFEENSGIVVMAATNAPEILDPALTRPGRFDRSVSVPLPDVHGRREILDLYLKNKPLAADVDSALLARRTPGFSGAELASLINEAALACARAGASVINAAALDEARDKLIMGIPRALQQVRRADGGEISTAGSGEGSTARPWGRSRAAGKHVQTRENAGKGLGVAAGMGGPWDAASRKQVGCRCARRWGRQARSRDLRSGSVASSSTTSVASWPRALQTPRCRSFCLFAERRGKTSDRIPRGWTRAGRAADARCQADSQGVHGVHLGAREAGRERVRRSLK